MKETWNRWSHDNSGERLIEGKDRILVKSEEFVAPWHREAFLKKKFKKSIYLNNFLKEVPR